MKHNKAKFSGFKSKSLFTEQVCGSDNSSDEQQTETETQIVNEPEQQVIDEQEQQKPSDTEAKLLKEVMQRKAKAKELEDEMKALKDQLNAYSGINLEEVKSLIEEKKANEMKSLEEKGQWEALKNQMKEENMKLLKEQMDKASQLQSIVTQQQELIDKLTLGSSFNSSGFILNELNLSPEKAKIIYGNHFEIENGVVVAYDKPRGSANRVQLIDADGEALGFDEAIKKIIDADPDKNILLKQKTKIGSASSTLPIGSKVEPKKPELSGIEKIRAALEQ